MEAAKEIQKKEIKLLDELQLRIRARVLDENVEEQNKYFVKNDIFNPADFPNHDFSYLNPTAAEEDAQSDDEEPDKPAKIRLLEAGIKNMVKNSDHVADIVDDEDTAVAALNICRKLAVKLDSHFQQYLYKPPDETLDKLKKVKHFFNNILIIQQILDVYPSAIKESAATVAKEHSAPPTSGPESRSTPAAFPVTPETVQYQQHASYPSASAHSAYPATTASPKHGEVRDPRSSKKAEGYSLYSDSVDQGGIEWYRKNKLLP